MKLTENDIRINKEEWLSKGYQLASFDRDAMIEKTKANPTWIHFGAGNIFRAYQASLAQRLLNQGRADTGIIAVDGFDYEIIQKNYWPHDNLSVLVTLKSSGTIEKTVIESIAESCILDSHNEEQYARLKEIFCKDSLQMATFTITEKGYMLADAKGNLMPAVEADYANGPAHPESYIGKVVSLLYARYQSCKKPIAMVSTDNCSHNGDKLFGAVDAYAKKWVENKLVEEGFAEYIENPKMVSFPWTMIDKITPRPDKSVETLLEKDGLDLEPVITSKNTYVAPFVNAEESEYLVIEDDFPNGHPALDAVGAYFTTRDTVNKVEKMKVCTCLNPLHTALAVFGCLLGYQSIYKEMNDEDLVKLVNEIGYTEGLPVVVDPGILNPKEFIDTVLQVRIPNPFMPDTPQRIATDTSQKLSVRYGETIKAYLAKGMDVHKLTGIMIVQAGWLRYLMGVDDSGNTFEPSPDPLYREIVPYVADFKVGTPVTAEEVKAKLLPVLKNKVIYGVDLEEVGMADEVCENFARMISSHGAIRELLHSYQV